MFIWLGVWRVLHARPEERFPTDGEEKYVRTVYQRALLRVYLALQIESGYALEVSG